MQITLNQETQLWSEGCQLVVGLDEVGRGPLAGPVVAAAVLVRPGIQLPFRMEEFRDSKGLSPKRREEVYSLLVSHPMIEWGRGRVSERVIDRINIGRAWQLAMKRAVLNLERKLGTKVSALIVDGSAKLPLPFRQLAIVKADQQVFSCAAASIIAKVSRDRMMVRYHGRYPEYRFDKHKGYGTPEHLALLRRYGPCEIHRQSFRPVALAQ